MNQGRETAAPLEWLAAAIGMAIFAGLFAIIFAQGLQGPTAPDLTIEQQRIVQNPGGSLVEFAVRNRSAQTAAAVVIEGKSTGSDGQEVTATVTIDYVPARSEVDAGLIFPGDIRGQQVEIRAVGYRLP